jgi:hypothetical protein
MGELNVETTRLADLPVLTTRRACQLADCSRATLYRSGIEPVGKRGRTHVYRTADILAWLSSGLERSARRALPVEERRAQSSLTQSALERLSKLRER